MCLPGTQQAVRRQTEGGESPRPRVSRRALLAGGMGAAAAPFAASAASAAAPAAASARPEAEGHGPPPGRPARGRPGMQDLTWTFATDFPAFTDGEEASRDTHVTIEDDGYYLQRWVFYEHSATHLDAPGHFVEGGRLAPDIRPEELFVPTVVVDIREKVARDHDAELTVDDLVAFERGNGRIPRGAAVLMRSGWEDRASSTEAYRGTDASGTYHFPGVDVEAAEWLVERRDIAGIGVDTLSLDHGPTTDFETHVALLGADRWGLENLCNLGAVPSRGAELFIGLVPWEGGSGGPCRVIARW